MEQAASSSRLLSENVAPTPSQRPAAGPLPPGSIRECHRCRRLASGSRFRCSSRRWQLDRFPFCSPSRSVRWHQSCAQHPSVAACLLANMESCHVMRCLVGSEPSKAPCAGQGWWCFLNTCTLRQSASASACAFKPVENFGCNQQKGSFLSDLSDCLGGFAGDVVREGGGQRSQRSEQEQRRPSRRKPR